MRGLLFAALLWIGSLPAQAQSEDWLARFATSLDPASRPSAMLADHAVQTRSDSILILADHFRSKPPLDPLWVYPMPDAPDPTFDLTRADAAVRHELITRMGSEQFGENLPWFSGEKQTNTLSRFPHFEYLTAAYFHTGDEQYAAAMVRDMKDFMVHVPISEADQYHVQVIPLINPWNWVLLQWRVKRWTDALAYMRESPSLPDSTYLQVVQFIWDEVDWLGPHKNVGLHNGTLGNLSAILYAAVTFPEARNASEWMDDAGGAYRSFLDFAFYPGEFLIELTVGYSEGTLQLCLDVFGGLPDGPIKERVRRPLEDLVDAHVGLMKPDRSLPRYGDHGVYDLRDRLLRKAARLFDRPDFAELANSVAPSVPVYSFPPESNPYVLSGYYAMRDGWSEDAMYLSMDAGPFGTNHHHADKLSITFSGDGAEFIVDPGTSLYRSIEPGPRYDLRFGFLHNVISIDGIDPNTGWDRHYGFDVLENRWVTNSEYDFLEGIYEFRNNLLDVIWRRNVLFKKGDYAVVLDALKGDGIHEVESNFQFMVGNDLRLEDDRVVATAENGASLDMITLPHPANRQIVVGDSVFPGTSFKMEYMLWTDWTHGGRGWVGTFGNASTLDFTRDYAAPALVMTDSARFPHHVVHVLAPSRGKVRQAVDVETVYWSSDSLQIRILGAAENGFEDTFVWRPAERPEIHYPVPDGSGWWSRAVGGALEQVILLNTDRFVSDRFKIMFDRRVDGYLTRDGEEWEIFVDPYLEEAVQMTTDRGDHTTLLVPGVSRRLGINR